MTIITNPRVQKERSILVIDGMNIFIRAFCVNGTTTTQGDPVGGAVGFMKSLFSLINRFVPQKVYVVWEPGGPSQRRKHIYEGYKANRAKDKQTFKSIGSDTKISWIKDDQENKIKQLHLLTQCLKHTPICQVYVGDCECDDVAAFLVKFKFRNENCTKILASSDKDFYQLLEDDSIEIYDPAKKIIIRKNDVTSMFNITPRNFCLAKTVAGDNSDNIPGVPGVGFKTLAKRLPEFGTDTEINIPDLMSLCEHKVNDEKSKLKIFKDILDNRYVVERNWKLMYLDSSSLTHGQIQKINHTVDTFSPKMDKFGLIKTLIEAGVNADINFDNVSTDLKTTLVEI